MTRRKFFELVFGAAAVVGFKTTFGIPIAHPSGASLLMDEIVTTTLRNRSAAIHANLVRNNALFSRLSQDRAA